MRLFVLLAVLLLVLFSLLRLWLIVSVRTASDATWGELTDAFLTGIRFDWAAACFMLAPVMLICYIPWTSPWRGRRTRRIVLWAVTLLVAIVGLLLVAEVEFFREFQSRYNQLAIRYLDQPATVAGMVWYNYPVVTYILVWLAAATALHITLWWCFRFANRAAAAERRPGIVPEIIGGAIVVGVILFGARGGVQSEPLRWGDAFRGDNEFVSQMSLNGLWCLGQAIKESLDRGEASGGWATQLHAGEARELSRKMLLAPGEKLLDPDSRTVLRQGDPGSSMVLRAADGKPLNVVVVMMESYSARYCGAAGAPRSFTPRFDALAKDGVLFDRCFSAGSHTHQGIFATLLGFPNLPGYETLMQSGSGNQHFLSLPEIFNDRGYKTFFLYNGNFAWDNMRGFFRKQGVDTFIGGDEMIADAKFRDSVWGVSDGDLFDRCNREFEAASKKGPFMAAVMTLSNHVPFQVPPVPGAGPITDMGEMNKRLEAMRYADYAVGKFIEDARKLSYFDHTLFVFVGDHGFAVQPKLTEVNLLFHHVPLLFYAPGLMPADRRGKVDHRVASQVNIAPSVLGLLKVDDSPQATWGRSLFNDGFADENFAIFKMSGGGRAVAIVRGDDLLVFTGPKAEPQHLRYTLWPPTVTTIPPSESHKFMARELKAYVQAALTDLTGQKAGPVSDISKK